MHKQFLTKFLMRNSEVLEKNSSYRCTYDSPRNKIATASERFSSDRTVRNAVSNVTIRRREFSYLEGDQNFVLYKYIGNNIIDGFLVARDFDHPVIYCIEFGDA